MPDFQKHLLSGLLLGVVLFFITKEPWVFLIATIYATLPDLDINTSIPFRFYAIATAGYAIFINITYVYQFDFAKDVPTIFGMLPYLFLAVPPLVGLIALQFVPHREWLHSISAGIVFALPMWFYVNFFGFLAGILGYYLHLLLDNELFDGIFT